MCSVAKNETVFDQVGALSARSSSYIIQCICSVPSLGWTLSAIQDQNNMIKGLMNQNR